MPDVYYTTTQAAEILNLTPGRVRQMLGAGELQGERVDTPRGPVWRIKKSEVWRCKDERDAQREARLNEAMHTGDFTNVDE